MFKVGDKVKWNGIDCGDRDVDGALKKDGGIIFTVSMVTAQTMRISNELLGIRDVAVWSKAFVVVEEERKLLPHGFRVGDRVYYTSKIDRDKGQKKFGIVCSDPRENDVKVFANWRGNPIATFMTVDEVFLVDDAPVEQKEGPMTRFVFCSRGGKYYTKSDHPTLEAATARAKRLRATHGTKDIYPFVIVED